MNYAVIHHPSRTINPSIERELGRYTVYADLRNEGCTAMHLKALRDAYAINNPTIIIEDDAILCHDFVHKSSLFFIEKCWDNGCDAVSFYLGQGAPTHMQKRFKSEINIAQEKGRDSIVVDNLYHAVCYCIEPRALKGMKRSGLLDKKDAPMIDELLSTQLHKVAYSFPSLADHDDSQPSIVEHTGARPTIPRVAWRFEG